MVEPAQRTRKRKRAPSGRREPAQPLPGPTLAWPGRAWSPGAPYAPPPPLRQAEKFGAEPGDRIILGDSLNVARALLARGLGGKVDLVYIDPPFASQADYSNEARLDGPADGRITRAVAYSDSWRSAEGDGSDGVGAYLSMLAPRLEAMARLLAPTGTLWVHLDWRAAYLVRVLLDEVLGRDRFVNEIVWRRAPNLGRQAASGQFGRTLDTLVVYGGARARLTPPTRLEPIALAAIRRDEEGRAFTTAPRGDYTDASMARLAAEGRVHTTSSGRMYVKYFLVPNEAGELCRERRIDTLWTDVPPLRHAPMAERTGYPTQKPRALLERVIRCSSPPGGLVVDLFAGSGTTGEVAQALGRRFVMADASPVAVNTARARLLRAGAQFTVCSCGEAAPPQPADDVEVRSSATEGGTKVELVRPAEPLTWAVGPRPAPGEPFVATWHSSRAPGAVPVPAAREARVSGPAPLEVRVYGDDGSVSTAAAPFPSSGRCAPSEPSAPCGPSFQLTLSNLAP